MSKVAIEGNASGTGTLTIAAPNTSTNRTLTLPDASGTMVVTGGAQTIEFAAGTAGAPSITTTGDTNTGIFFPAADTIAFAEGGAEAMRIDSSGQVGIAQTPSAGGGPLQVTYNSSTNAGLRLTTNNASIAGELINFIKSTGTAAGAITFGASQNTIVYGGTSDYRLKENIIPMTGALAKVALLNPVTYNWKSDGSAGQGFIAHELAEVCPDAVVGQKDAVDADGNPQYQGVDTSFLVATLTAAIQELKAELDEAKVRIAALETGA